MRETIVLASLCFIDMSHTIYVIASGKAIEANPLLAPIVHHSWLAFAWVKSLSFLLPLAAVEALRPLNPDFIRRAVRFGAIGYVLFYIVGSLHINHVFGR